MYSGKEKPPSGCFIFFVQLQVVEAVDSLYAEFKAVDNLVAHNTTRVLKAFQNARVGYHVSKRAKLIIIGKMFYVCKLTWMPILPQPSFWF